MAKQLISQRYVFKIHTSRLRRAKWNLRLTQHEAKACGEMVSLGDSQILRWIDELNGRTEDAPSVEQEIRDTRAEIRRRRKEGETTRQVGSLYRKLDSLQFRPDYLCLIIDRVKDYQRANKGFTVNGIEYRRLLGTNGGIKTSTIVYVSERLYPELKSRIDNGRNMEMPMVPAKLEAYQALVCSGSTPVSMPRGIAVIPDCVTHFKSDIVRLSDENDGEPEMVYEQEADVELKASDGFGLMAPELAARWSAELGLDYVMSGCNTRFSFSKGMVFAFDFLKFADEVAGTRIIKDSWGNDVDLGNVELVLTESMVKLWNGYESINDYLSKSAANHYTFGVPKVCPRRLDRRRSLNYQFIQSYDLTDDQVEELIRPTVDNLHDVLGLDWRRTVLFLRGADLTERTVLNSEDDIAKAIMADSRVAEDPYVRRRVLSLIRERVNDAKIGVIEVHGNYSMMLGDPYALCQSMCGLPVTGLLKAGEIYNKYWLDDGAERVACFRAPMSCHANIRLANIHKSAEADKWYSHIDTATILNAWDMMCAAMNGADFDGDMVFTTDNNILVNCVKPQPALACAQRNAPKKIPTEDDIINSNIAAFGDEIGKITNRVTSMYDVQSWFEPDSEEYKILDYRIKCGQLYQQNSIDKAKGIISKPMPKSWYDIHAVHQIEEEDQKEMYTRIIAEKKPYFMRYIYPDLMQSYNNYTSDAAQKCELAFAETLEELMGKSKAELTDAEKTWLKYYRIKMPVSLGNSVMNRICRRFEQEFDGYASKHIDYVFDPSIYKSGVEYEEGLSAGLTNIIRNYLEALSTYMAAAKADRYDDSEIASARSLLFSEFAAKCHLLIPDETTLCDVMVDVCYGADKTRRLLWDLCPRQIVENLTARSGGLTYPEQDDEGDIEYKGERFTLKFAEVE